MRITNSMHFDALTGATSRLENRLLTASKEAQTGLKVAAPEDDPTGAAALVRLGTIEDQTQSFKSSIQRVQSEAELSEGTLASATDLFTEAKSVALQGASGALSASDRAILSKQVDGMLTDLLSLANTKGEHGYIFAGSATHTAPFDPAFTFVGNDDARNVDIAQGVSITSNTSGAKAFTAAGGTDAFQALQTLKAALDANDVSAIGSSVKGLDDVHGQITAARADTGLLLTRLEATSSTHTQSLTLLASAKHGIADADLPTAYSQLSQAQTTYTQAVSVNKQVLSTLSAWFNA
jgi:flagellar hook-associated protein 3 FlgL